MFQWLADKISYSIFGLGEATFGGLHFAGTINYFLYDTFKILTLVFVVVTVIAFVRTFFDPASIKNAMAKTSFGLGNLVAAIFGAVTPFCSCSSVPLFIGFIKAGVPVGIAFSFIITSPLVNEVVFVMMGGIFGWKLAIIYALTGIILGVIGGLLIGAFGPKDGVILDRDKKGVAQVGEYLPKTFSGKIEYAVRDGIKTFKKLFFYILAGVALGAAIHGYVPKEFFMNYIGKYSVLSVPIAVLIGVPIYAGCSTVVPVIFSITSSGVPLGTSLAFLMAIAGLSLPEGIMLKRALSTKLLLTFFGIVAIGITIIGYLFNFLERVML